MSKALAAQSAAARLAKAAQARVLTALGQRASGLVEAGSATIENGRLVLRGQSLARRWLTDPDLRFLGRNER